MSAPVGVILAGGRSTRMGGGDKCLLSLGGVPILQRVIARLQPQVRAMAINANGDPARFAQFGLPVVADSLSDHPGPLAGVLAAMDWAAERNASHVVTVAADTPFFPNDLVVAFQVAGDFALAATRDDTGRIWRHPTFGIWPVALREDLRAAITAGVRKVVAWTDKHGAQEAIFTSAGGDPFFNVNTPEDLVAAEAMA